MIAGMAPLPLVPAVPAVPALPLVPPLAPVPAPAAPAAPPLPPEAPPLLHAAAATTQQKPKKTLAFFVITDSLDPHSLVASLDEFGRRVFTVRAEAVQAVSGSRWDTTWKGRGPKLERDLRAGKNRPPSASPLCRA